MQRGGCRFWNNEFYIIFRACILLPLAHGYSYRHIGSHRILFDVHTGTPTHTRTQAHTYVLVRAYIVTFTCTLGTSKNELPWYIAFGSMVKPVFWHHFLFMFYSIACINILCLQLNTWFLRFSRPRRIHRATYVWFQNIYYCPPLYVRPKISPLAYHGKYFRHLSNWLTGKSTLSYFGLKINTCLWSHCCALFIWK